MVDVKSICWFVEAWLESWKEKLSEVTTIHNLKFKLALKEDVFILCVRIFVWMSVCAHAHALPAEVSDPSELKLGLLAVMWMLRLEPGSSGRATSAFYTWAIFPAPSRPKKTKQTKTLFR